MGNALALITLSSAVSLDVQSMLIPVFSLIFAGLVTVFPKTPGYIPPWFWKFANVFLVAFLIVDFLRSEFVAALIDLNVLLILLRSLSYRKKREDMQLILLCLFLIVITGVLSQALSFALNIFMFSCIGMALLFVINLRDNGIEIETNKETFSDFHWTTLLLRLFNNLRLRHLLFACGLFGILVCVAAVIFVSFPRFNIGQAVPFLKMKSAKTYTGFSENVGFGDVTDIQDDNSVALRVDVPPMTDVPSSPYWRMLVLDVYSRGMFSVSKDLKEKVDERNGINRFVYRPRYVTQHFPEVNDAEWTFYLEGGVSRYLPATGIFQELRFQEQQDVICNAYSHVYNLKEVSAGVTFYQVKGMALGEAVPDSLLQHSRVPVTLAMLKKSELFDPYEYPSTTLQMNLEESELEYLRQEVATIRGNGNELGPLEFAKAAAVYLGSKHQYAKSNRLPEGKGDPVVRWLQSKQPGHCEYFGASLILLCRSAGIPARMVTGFQGGTWNAYENYFMVRNSNAHAWVEVFDGESYWVRVDPTPGGLQASLSLAEAAKANPAFSDESWKAYMDSLRMLWYRKVVNFEDEDQIALLDGIWYTVKDYLQQVPVFLDRLIREARMFMSRPWEVSAYKTFALFFLALLAMYLVLRYVWKRFRTRKYYRFLGAGRRGASPGIEDRIRAGRMLRKLKKKEEKIEDGDVELNSDMYRAKESMLRIRFGEVAQWPDRREVFSMARSVVRRCR